MNPWASKQHLFLTQKQKWSPWFIVVAEISLPLASSEGTQDHNQDLEREWKGHWRKAKGASATGHTLCMETSRRGTSGRESRRSSSQWKQKLSSQHNPSCFPISDPDTNKNIVFLSKTTLIKWSSRNYEDRWTYRATSWCNKVIALTLLFRKWTRGLNDRETAQKNNHKGDISEMFCIIAPLMTWECYAPLTVFHSTMDHGSSLTRHCSEHSPSIKQCLAILLHHLDR